MTVVVFRMMRSTLLQMAVILTEPDLGCRLETVLWDHRKGLVMEGTMSIPAAGLAGGGRRGTSTKSLILTVEAEGRRWAHWKEKALAIQENLWREDPGAQNGGKDTYSRHLQERNIPPKVLCHRRIKRGGATNLMIFGRARRVRNKVGRHGCLSDAPGVANGISHLQRVLAIEAGNNPSRLYKWLSLHVRWSHRSCSSKRGIKASLWRRAQDTVTQGGGMSRWNCVVIGWNSSGMSPSDTRLNVHGESAEIFYENLQL
ncbi:hypothetical protein EV359DRAFT_68494 [Lentinula novae-zelandiae]|nr:hypothetical protein EV359DRAFT_68494 [Lentinula novae-zelandiae]